MKHLGLSVGGTKIVGLYESAKELMSHIDFDVISGISAGAILALPLAMSKFEEMDKVIDNLSINSFMDSNPFNKKGNIKIGSILRLLFKGSITSQNSLLNTLKDIISEEEFIKWQNNSSTGVYIQAIDFVTGGRIIKCLNNETYEDALLYIVASASIPFVTNPIEIGDNKLFDGGVRNYILTPWVLDNLPISESISIYTRPENYSGKKWDWKVNPLNILSRYIDIVNIEISKSSEVYEKSIAKIKDINHHIIYLPSVLNGVYDTDKNRLRRLREYSKKITKQFI